MKKTWTLLLVMVVSMAFLVSPAWRRHSGTQLRLAPEERAQYRPDRFAPR